MIEDGVDFGDEGELIGVPFLWKSEDLSADDDFVEEGVDWDFLIGGLGGVVKADTGCPVAFVDVDGASSHVDSAGSSLCVFEDSANGFFGSGANGIIRVVLTDVVILCDHAGGAVLNGLDNVRHSDSFVDVPCIFFELFVGGAVLRGEESECLRDDVVGVDVTVDVFGGKFVDREAWGRHAGCVRESSSCCC